MTKLDVLIAFSTMSGMCFGAALWGTLRANKQLVSGIRNSRIAIIFSRRDIDETQEVEYVDNNHLVTVDPLGVFQR